MKALTDRLEMLRTIIVEAIADPAAKQDALDCWIEANAIAEALPEITIELPKHVRPMSRTSLPNGRPPWDAVVSGGQHQEKP